MSDQDQDSVPILSVHEVYNRIRKARRPHSIVLGDLPPRLVKSFADILAGPLTLIYNEISITAEYLQQWKVEHQIPIPKVLPPTSKDELRNISKTPFVKLQSQVQTSVLGLGVDFVLPLSQQQQQEPQEQEEEPSPKSIYQNLSRERFYFN